MRPEDKQVQDFADIEEIKQRFMQSKNYNFADEIDVGGIPFKRNQGSNYDMRALIDKSVKQMVA